MTPTSDSCIVDSPVLSRNLSKKQEFLYLVLFMSEVLKKNSFKNERKVINQSTEEKFKYFLDGYFQSFDLFPVCDRHVYSKTDIDSVLDDFWSVVRELNITTQEFVSSPDQLINDIRVDDHDIGHRKSEAARRALKGIINKLSEK